MRTGNITRATKETEVAVELNLTDRLPLVLTDTAIVYRAFRGKVRLGRHSYRSPIAGASESGEGRVEYPREG